jgi:hypothetical protein
VASLAFTVKNRRPTEAAIVRALGRAGAAWHLLFEQIESEHPDLSETWNYYADGKSWLLKVARRSKTVFWLSVEEGGFRVSFFFPDRLAGVLLDNDLSEECKTAIRETVPTGKLRAVTVRFGPKRRVRDVMTLIALKASLR